MSIEDYTGHWVQAASPGQEKLNVSCFKVTDEIKITYLKCASKSVSEVFVNNFTVNGPFIENTLTKYIHGEYSKDGPTVTWQNGKAFFTTWTRPSTIACI